MDDSLESLLEKATNPKNKYEDWEFIMSFCDRVNAEPEGPQVALKIIVPKMRHENEKVSMLALALLEACVKNCGQRFHQELGKFRFLNEFIKMLSEKYLGKQTPPVIKDKIKSLLYSWRVGLPTEGKISEAYEMLKKEGLVFDETQPADPTLQPEKQKPKVSLAQDPKQAKMLQKLLASRNPDDLRAANRLIREMVRRDDKRMERMKRRLDDLELVQNNIKLMNELMSHYKPESGDQEKPLLQELYRSLEKMRPNMFRMASNLKPEEEGMDEILQTNDDLLRVMDTYKRVVGVVPVVGEGGAGPTQNGGLAKGEGGGAGKMGNEVPEEAAAAGGGTGLGGGGGGGGDASTLIDLADLDFGAIPTTGVAPVTPSTADSLLDALGTLDFSATGVPATSQNMSLLDFPPILTSLSPASQPQAVATNSIPALSTTSTQLPMGTTSTQLPMGTLPTLPMGTLPTQLPVGTTSSQPFTIPPPPSTHFPVMYSGSPVTQPRAQSKPVSSGFNQLPSSNNSTSSASGATDPFGDLGLNFTLGLQPPKPAVGGGGVAALGQVLAPATTTAAAAPAAPQTWGSFQSDPLAVLNDLTMSKDQIQPSYIPPLQVLNKNGITVSLYFTKNTPAPHVAVMVISTISTNALPVSQFQIKVAVPKVMRVKLQTPTGTELAPYNPMLPPSNVSQIMLLANPTKENVRLKYQISWTMDGAESVETGEVANFPAQ